MDFFRAKPPIDPLDPHGDQPLLLAGESLGSAQIALVLVHGRGDTPERMLPIARAAKATDVAILAPRAAGKSWYPHRFSAPLATNQPFVDSALTSIDRAIRCAEDAGIPRSRTVIAGFSQGACLSLEYAVRNGTRYGGVVAMAGSLMGEPTDERMDAGNLERTPVVLSCGDADEYFPEALVRGALCSVGARGAETTFTLYRGVGHSIVGHQLETLQAIVDALRG